MGVCMASSTLYIYHKKECVISAVVKSFSNQCRIRLLLHSLVLFQARVLTKLGRVLAFSETWLAILRTSTADYSAIELIHLFTHWTTFRFHLLDVSVDLRKTMKTVFFSALSIWPTTWIHLLSLPKRTASGTRLLFEKTSFKFVIEE